jgi:hypothetical protein
MTQQVSDTIQALRDKADWLESLPEAKQEEIGWEVPSHLVLSFWAYSEQDAWTKRVLISGPGVTKEVSEDQTIWTRKVTESFSLSLTLPRSSTCKPVYETEYVTEPIDGIATWDPDTGKYQITRKVNKRVGWDCGDSDTP